MGRAFPCAPRWASSRVSDLTAGPGPYADRPGFDPILQSLAGHMVIQGGTAGGPPQFVRIAINDYLIKG